MNVFFVLIRMLNYLLLIGLIIYFDHSLTWSEWMISLPVMIWGIWDFWKKPNDDVKFLCYGVWLEGLTITCWIATVRSDVLLFAYISPLTRASIHLSFRDRILFFISSGMMIGLYGWWIPASHIFIPLLALFFVGAYSSIIGSLVNERKRAQRLLGLSEFEKEQSVRENERIRISRQLHDTMGQYWTVVIRTIDAAEAVDMPSKQIFIQKARKAAELGLEEMRKVVRNSNEGKRTAEQWIHFALKSLERLKELTSIEIEMDCPDKEWEIYNQRLDVSELLARTMLESLSNAIRHGKATKVWIKIFEHKYGVILSIRDNGVGLVKDIQKSNGIGFQSLQEMTKDVGGTFQIESERNNGTTITLNIPFEGGKIK
jgi:signal transduction histidine kinase